METNTASHMLIFRDSHADLYKGMSPEQRQQLLQRWNAWYDSLAAQGKLEAGRPLEREGRIVSSQAGRIVDGPFAEAKEAVGGFFMLTVSSMDEAVEIARQCPGLPHGIVVEVRPLADCCPVLRAGRQAQRETANITA